MKSLSSKPELQAILKSRYSYYLQLMQYLQQIERQEIPNDEVAAFASDVLGFEVAADAAFHLTILPDLMKSVQRNELFYQRLNLAIKNDDANFGLPTIYYMLNMQAGLSRYFEKKKTKKNVTYANYAQMAFNEFATLSQLIQLLQPLLPTILVRMQAVICLDKTIEQVKSKKQKRLDDTISIGMKYKWQSMLENITSALTKIAQVNSLLERSPDLLDPENSTEETPKLLTSPTLVLATQKMFRQLCQLMDNNAREDTGMAPDALILQYQNLEKNIRAFVENDHILQAVEHLINYINNAIPKAKQRLAVSKFYLEQRTKKMEQLAKLLDKNRQNIDKLNSLKYSNDDKTLLATVSEVRAELAEIETALEAQKAFWPDTLSAIDNTRKDVDVLLSNANKAIHEFRIQLDKAATAVTDCFATKEQLVLAKAQAKVQRQVQAAAKEKQKYEAYFQQRQEQLIAYRTSVEQARKDKTEAKKRPRSDDDTTDDISTAEADNSAQAKATIQHQAPSPTGDGSSVASAQIAALSNKCRETLREVLENQYGIRYEKVCTLIVALGGVIDEIGNGSSHKRIWLGSTATMELHSHHSPKQVDATQRGKLFDTTSKASASKTSSATTSRNNSTAAPRAHVTGTLVKPHGMNCSVLSHFNGKCLKAFFNRAGYTSALLNRAANTTALVDNPADPAKPTSTIRM